MADNSDSLEDAVRRCVREELNTHGNVTSQTLVNRTRNLIRSSASFSARQLGETGEQQSVSRSEFSRNAPAMSARAHDRSTSLTGHPLRKRKAPSSKQKAHVVPKTVNLNADDEEEDDCQNDEYTIKEEMILVKGEFDLLTGADEQTIRQELKDLFKVKFPLISETDFDFVTRERNTILTPVVKENHLWDYAHVKHLCGAGKLYVTLNICKDVISGNSSDDSDSTSLPVMLPPTDYRPQACSTSTPRSVAVDDEVPSTSSGVSLMDENISSLTVLFPEAKLSEIRDTLIQCGSLELAAEKLSEKADSACTCVQSDTCMDASRILKQLKLKMKGYGLAEKIKVDREDLIDNVLNGVCVEVLGNMVAHSMIQGGLGFPYLSPVVYWYVATGDLQQGIARASALDISDGILEDYVTRENNRLSVVQPLVIHESLIKHKVVQDQFRKGLTLLGLLEEIEKEPRKFKHLFVHQKGQIHKDFVQSLIHLPDSTNPSIVNVTQMLLSIISSANEDVLCKLLGFITGCKSVTAALRPDCIRVTVEDTPNIFASTCTMEFKLPLHFSSSEQFDASLNAVLDSSSFNTV